MPRVSVIMGVHNGARKMEKAIESILNQTYKDFEFIIADDGSVDDSISILNSFAWKDPRIKLISNGHNLGLAPTLNKCLALSSGEYIARMDDDDISHSTRLDEQVSFLDSHPEYAIVGTSRNMYDSNGIWGRSVLEGERTKLDIFLGKSFVHPSVLIRKVAVIEVGGYSEESVGRSEDYDLWCKMYEKGYKGYNLSNILLDYYEAKDSYFKRKYRYRLSEYYVRRKWYSRLGIHSKYLIWTLRPLFVGLIPNRLLIMYHKKKFKICL